MIDCPSPPHQGHLCGPEGVQPFDLSAIELDDRRKMFIEDFAVMGARVMQQECNTGEADNDIQDVDLEWEAREMSRSFDDAFHAARFARDDRGPGDAPDHIGRHDPTEQIRVLSS